MPHEPKKKHGKAEKRIRRASIKLDAIALQVCSNCGANTLSHMACRECGFYKGKQVAKQKVVVTKA